MKHNSNRFSDKYFQLSELGSKLGLSFSSHFAMGNRIIAFDGLKKKLVVVEKNAISQPCIIDLSQVKTISIKKMYGSIKSGELNKKGLRQFLQSIHLQFEYSGEDKKIVLPFYEHETDRVQDLPRLERNARNWQLILSKMINPPDNNPVAEKRQLQSAG